jgi:hypothetical protein
LALRLARGPQLSGRRRSLCLKKNATNSAVPSLDPPEVQALFGDPPLMRGEDIGAYNKLLDQFGELVEPTDVLEWLLLKDIADHT